MAADEDAYLRHRHRIVAIHRISRIVSAVMYGRILRRAPSHTIMLPLASPAAELLVTLVIRSGLFVHFTIALIWPAPFPTQARAARAPLPRSAPLCAALPPSHTHTHTPPRSACMRR